MALINQRGALSLYLAQYGRKTGKGDQGELASGEPDCFTVRHPGYTEGSLTTFYSIDVVETISLGYDSYIVHTVDLLS